MKELHEMPTEYIECDCHTELIQLTFEDNEKEIVGGDDLSFLYLSFYNLASYKGSWCQKARHIWHILKYGHPWQDQICLRKSDRLKLTEYLNKLP